MVELLVSANGVDWVSDLQVAYEGDRAVSSVRPAAGHVRGGTRVVLTGTGFRFDAAADDELATASPTASLRPYCRFGSVDVPASVLSETQLACETPAVQEPGAVALGVVLRYPHTKRRVDVPFDGEALSFVYQLEPSVLTIEPKSGSARGGTPVTLSGAGFADTPELSVRFAVDGLGRDAPAVVVRASFVSDTQLVVETPPSASGVGGGFVAVSLSINGHDFSRDSVLFFYDESVAVSGVRPASVPEHGGTVVTVSGANFAQTFPSALACRFGGPGGAL